MSAEGCPCALTSCGVGRGGPRINRWFALDGRSVVRVLIPGSRAAHGLAGPLAKDVDAIGFQGPEFLGGSMGP